MKEIKTLGTHDGRFHCDEVLGCAMLKFLHPNVAIIRSRKEEILKDCDIVIDVGGKYDPDQYRFDHHQKGFEHSASTVLPGKKWTVKLSSAGLVYCHFGKEIIKSVIPDIKEENVDIIFDKVYENLIQEVDGIDNGVPIAEGELAYTIHTSLSSRVGSLNKNWNVPDKDFNETQAFEKAMDLVRTEFVDKIKYYTEIWLPARTIVADAVENRFKTHPSGEIILINPFCPWISHYFELETNMKIEPTVKFAVFGENIDWRVRALPIDENSFILRTPLDENWRGIREDELCSKTNIAGCVFVHMSGFIGGNKTVQGAIQMAAKTLENIKLAKS